MSPLERRLMDLEKEVATLRQLLTPNPHETEAQRIERQWRQSRANQPDMNVIIEEAFRKMGIPPGPPTMTPEELQKLMIAEGVRPEDNEASREIIRMREE